MSQLKDLYFQEAMLKELAKAVERSTPEFSAEAFLKVVQTTPWIELEFMDRMRKVTDCLRAFLPEDYPKALRILRSVAASVTSFDAMLFPDFVQRFGVEYPDESIPALEYFTELCSSEFGVRPFIERYPDRIFKQLETWARSSNVHHRRLASEGCRPRLPWASSLKELIADPTPIFPVLELLKTDPEDYVRRSVANNLNDISKDHPDTVVGIAKRWKGTHTDTDWIIKHACRTMLKQGRADVLQLHGFAPPTSMNATDLQFDREHVKIGAEVIFQCSLKTTKPELGKIRLEYVIHFIKANGQPSPKVFQISERIEPNQVVEVKKRHSFKNLSTRKHFPGTHRFEVRVNGVCKSKGCIEVLN